MSEEQIERWVEMQVDKLDSLYMRDQLTTAEYQNKMNDVKQFADLMYQNN